MEASLSFDQLKKLSENMKVEVPFTAVNTDDNVLLFLYMTDDIGKAERIKKSESIITEVQYLEQINSFIVWIIPVEYANKILNEKAILKYAACGLVKVDDKMAFQMLNDMVDRKATAEIYVFDRRLKCISIKHVLSNDTSLSNLNNALNKYNENQYKLLYND
mgnify:FL=1